MPDAMKSSMILSIRVHDVPLEIVGGKGANLAKLASAGFPVPDGFLVTTDAYRLFVTTNGLSEKIQARVERLQTDDPAELEEASAEIRRWFSEGQMPSELGSRLKESYAELKDSPVAVRSSATAEDLPDLSFAGQQDTFLNVIGDKHLEKAVVDCWSSLWTARAISYRNRNEIQHHGVALAVVVQKMVPSEASGVLFTANPLTGKRDEAVIDATFGLGEALVGGHVEPDHYVVDLQTRQITKRSLGSKAVAIRGRPDGGVVFEDIQAGGRQALPEEQILELAELGQEVAHLYDFPQDIEWAWAEGQLYLLQSRPITSLFPVPAGMGPEPLEVLFSFGSVQGLLGPMTPLGQDAIRLIFAGGASIFGFQLTHETQPVIKIAGERLWGVITPVLRNPVGRRALPFFFSGIDPGALPALKTVIDDPRLGAGTGRLRLSTLRRFAAFAFPFWRRMFGAWRAPEKRLRETILASQEELARIRTLSKRPPGGEVTLVHSIKLFREIYHAFPFAIPAIATSAAAGLLPLFILGRMSRHLTGSADLALEVTRGLPNNVTTEMDLELWKTARLIRANPEAYQHMREHTAAELASDYLSDRLPETAQRAFAAFLERYGMRGLGEIDIGRPRWREDPTQIMEVMGSYLQIEDETMTPDAVFRQGEKAADAAIARLQEAASRTFGGRLKSRLVGWAARRVRVLAGLRESPKFHIIQMMGIIREGLLGSGQELTEAGILGRREDIFFLTLNELEDLAQDQLSFQVARVTERWESNRREMARQQVPRLLLSDGQAFYDGMLVPDGDSGALHGSPVSPGVIEASVRVVLDPQRADLKPGEIMVCPGTDPAWTPLFLAAGGLVMEVGGMMTHGAIVAREYGIPAVVGVHQATTLLRTGQRILVNGSTGEIRLLEDS